MATIDDLTTAEKFRSREVFIDDELVMNTDQYFYEDIMKKKVVTIDGREIGVVVGILTSPIYEILEVKGDKEFLIPWIDVFVKSVDEVVTVDIANLEEMNDEG